MNSVDRAVLALERALGSSRVCADPTLCAALAKDESDVAPVTPACVLRPATSDHVASALAICDAHEVPVFARGGGTGRTGGAVPLRRGVLLDSRAMADITELDRRSLLVVAQPGVVTAELQRAVEAEGLFFPPDPLSAPWSCIAGNVAENAGGPRAFKYGVTRDWTLGMEAVLMGGETLQVGRRTAKGVAGYDLAATLVGSEGTLAIFTSLTLRLTVTPASLRALTATFTTLADAGAAVTRLLAAGVRPRCIELIDDVCCEVMRQAEPDALGGDVGAMLLVEADGDSDAEVDLCVARTAEICESFHGARAQAAASPAAMEALWSARRVMSRALRKVRRHKLSEDVVVPRGQLVPLLQEIRAISERRGVLMPTYGHAGDGNLHVNFLWDHDEERAAVDRAVEDLFRATLALRGTLSGEHGIGVTKRDYLAWEQSDGLLALQSRVKRAFDPRGLLNPDKVLPAPGTHHGC